MKSNRLDVYVVLVVTVFFVAVPVCHALPPGSFQSRVIQNNNQDRGDRHFSSRVSPVRTGLQAGNTARQVELVIEKQASGTIVISNSVKHSRAGSASSTSLGQSARQVMMPAVSEMAMVLE